MNLLNYILSEQVAKHGTVENCSEIWQGAMEKAHQIAIKTMKKILFSQPTTYSVRLCWGIMQRSHCRTDVLPRITRRTGCLRCRISLLTVTTYIFQAQVCKEGRTHYVPVEEARLSPKGHDDIAARIEVITRDCHLSATRHRSPLWLEIRECQSLWKEKVMLKAQEMSRGTYSAKEM